MKYKISKDVLAELVLRKSIQAVKGPAGSLLFFHGLLLHASANNLSPWDRVCVFVTYNSVKNALFERNDPRPDYIAHRNFTPLRPIPNDALLEVEVGAR